FWASAGVGGRPGRGGQIIRDVGKPPKNRCPRKAGNARHKTDTATPQGASFQCNKPAAALFIENGSDLLVSLAGSARLREANHAAKLCRQIPARESPSVRTSHCVTRLTHSFMDGPLAHVNGMIPVPRF